MNTAKSLISVSVAMVCLTAPVLAGDAGSPGVDYGSNGSYWSNLAWKPRPKKVIRRNPVVFLGRVWESVLHAPQILSDAVEGDRVLANKNGLLAPRDTPAEDTLYTPDE